MTHLTGLTSLIGLSQQSIVSNAVNYIGKTIEGQSSTVPLQNGALKAGYGLNAAAKTATVVVRDDGGNIVFTKAGDPSKGVHEFDWDGKDSNGQQLKDGSYTVSLTTDDGTGKPVDNYITAFGKVTGVTTINGATLLLMDNVGVSTDKVLSITDTPTPAPTTTATNPNTDASS